MRKVSLESVPVTTALERLLTALGPCRLPAEQVPAEEALGRTTACAVSARLSSPHYQASAMDGFAVLASETRGACATEPIRLARGSQALWVDTGDPLPPGRNAVVRVEDSVALPDGFVAIVQSVEPWQHVRLIGEDIVAASVVVPEGRVLGPAEVGALLAAGVSEVNVLRRPVVTFIPTGNELVEPGPNPAVGELIEFNSRMVLAMVREWGGIAVRHPIVSDDREALRRAVAGALVASDVVVVNAGSSSGTEDFTAEVLRELGDVLVHGVALRPGKPVMLGIAQSKAVLGLPGYPVAAWLTADLFLKPLVCRLAGARAPRRPTVCATLTQPVSSASSVDEYIRVRLGLVGDRWVCTPLGSGAAAVSSLVRAAGLLAVPRGTGSLAEGEQALVELLRPEDELRESLLVAGCHDAALDLLDALLRREGSGTSVSYQPAGDGLESLRRGEAHVAALQLPEGEDEAQVMRRLGRPVTLVHVATRERGLMVAPGNRRQATAYSDEPAYRDGDLATAAAIVSGVIQTGLGTRKAARVHGLEFLPLRWERYLLCIPDDHMQHPGVLRTLATLSSPGFRSELAALDGYRESES